MFLKVLVGSNEVLTPNGARSRLMASDVPCTYGIDANWGFVVVVSGFKRWGCLGWDIRTMAFLGYPLSSRDSTMVCCRGCS